MKRIASLVLLALTLILGSSSIVSAFPTTPVLDAFNRADGALSGGGGNWTTPAILSTDTDLSIVSQQVTGSAPGSINSAYWNVLTFSTNPGVEVYYDAVTVGAPDAGGSNRFVLLLCIQNPGSGSFNAYQLSTNRLSNVWRMFRFDNNVATQIGVDVTQAISAGDGIGFRNLVGVLEVWYRTGGVWSMLTSVGDGTYTSGFIAAAITANVNVLDNVGGGATTGLFRNQGDLSGLGTGGAFRKDPLQYRPLRRGIDYDFGDRVKVPYLW